MALYAQGYSVTSFLVGASNRQQFLGFVATGMNQGWDAACQSYYHYRSVEELEQAWLTHMRNTRRPPVQLAANPNAPGQPPRPISCHSPDGAARPADPDWFRHHLSRCDPQRRPGGPTLWRSARAPDPLAGLSSASGCPARCRGPRCPGAAGELATRPGNATDGTAWSTAVRPRPGSDLFTQLKRKPASRRKPDVKAPNYRCFHVGLTPRRRLRSLIYAASRSAKGNNGPSGRGS